MAWWNDKPRPGSEPYTASPFYRGADTPLSPISDRQPFSRPSFGAPGFGEPVNYTANPWIGNDLWRAQVGVDLTHSAFRSPAIKW